MSVVKQIFKETDGDFKKFSRGYLGILQSYFDRFDFESLEEIRDIFQKARLKRKKIFFAGNGGSAATASHSVCDYAIGPRDFENGFRCISLNDNMPSITALSNDMDYSEVFARQIQTLGSEGDVLVAISASGNSKNLIKAVQEAKRKRLITVSWTGFSGGEIAQIVDCNILVSGEQGDYGPVEDLHLIINHILSNFFIEEVKNSR